MPHSDHSKISQSQLNALAIFSSYLLTVCSPLCAADVALFFIFFIFQLLHPRWSTWHRCECGDSRSPNYTYFHFQCCHIHLFVFCDHQVQNSAQQKRHWTKPFEINVTKRSRKAPRITDRIYVSSWNTSSHYHNSRHCYRRLIRSMATNYLLFISRILYIHFLHNSKARSSKPMEGVPTHTMHDKNETWYSCKPNRRWGMLNNAVNSAGIAETLNN